MAKAEALKLGKESAEKAQSVGKNEEIKVCHEQLVSLFTLNANKQPPRKDRMRPA